MAEVFLCERGQLNDVAKRDLRRAGIVVAEVADLARCQFVRASEVVSPDDLLWAALDALSLQASYSSDGSKQREQLAKNLLAVVNAARAK